jgi:hypothetical protein
MSDDIKKAAERIVFDYSRADDAGADIAGYADEYNVARAYLALREQVETVVLPALKPFADEADRRPFLGPDACRINLASSIGGSSIANIDLVTARAAIKAIEEGRA